MLNESTLRTWMIASCLLLGILYLSTPQVLAAEPTGLSVLIDVAAESKLEKPLEVKLQASPDEGPSAVLERQISVPWQGTLDLDREISWRISLEADAFWAPETVAQPDSEEMELVLFPAAIIAGRIEPTPSGLLPADIGIRFQSSPAPIGESSRSIPRTALRCPVVERQWSCEVPAGRLDLRLAADGFVPYYLWDIGLAPGQTTDLGLLQLETGASVAGWIAQSQPDRDQTKARIALERQVSGWQGDPRERLRLDALTLHTRASERGFFQLKGIPAGGYILSVDKPGFATAKLPDISIGAGEETYLGNPIVLFPPAKLELFFDPPVDPAGMAWSVALGQLEPRSTVLTTREESTASLEGFCQLQDLDAGTFLLEVNDAQGSTWVERWIDIEPEMTPLFVEIPVVPIEGRVSLGDEPLRATLAFGSTQGAVQIKLTTEEDGSFKGYLPREGRWPVDVVFEEKTLLHQAIDPVEVRRRPGKRTTNVDIVLPDTLLTGTVVAEDDPVPEANVAIMRDGEEKRREAVLKADDHGEFELRGLSKGTLLIKAYKDKRSTSWIKVDLQEDLDPEIRLELRERIELSGLVLSSSGEVPGAEIAALPRMAGGSVTSLARALSGFDGSFTLELPASSMVADLIVSAPGFAHQMVRVPVARESPSPAMIHVDGGGGTLVMADEVVGSSNFGRSESVLQHNGTTLHLGTLITFLVPKMKVSTRAGSLALLDMAPGEYRLCVASGAKCDVGFLPPQGELALRLGSVDAR